MAKKKSTTRKKTTAKGQQGSQAKATTSRRSTSAAVASSTGSKKTTKKKAASKKASQQSAGSTASAAQGQGKKSTTRAASSKSGSKTGKKTTKRTGKSTGSSPSAPPPPAPVAGTTAPPPLAASQMEGDRFNGQQLSDQELRKIKSGLTRQELDAFRRLLLEKRAELIGDVESLQKDARNDDASISYEHMADVGTDSYEQEFTLGLVESERKLLREIDEALERINKGTYGVCVVSGEPIGKPRLEAKPWAKHSIEVARERERRGLG